MQFRKLAAIAGSALMSGMTLAGAALAATNVGNIASLAAPSDSVANFPVFVIGKIAASSDVAGAVDIAVRMAAESKTTTTVTTAGAAAEVDGISRDGINIGTASGGSALSTAITGGAAFPSGSIVKNTHYSKLKDATYSHRSTDYDYREQVDASGVRMRHDLTTDKINGTETMVIGTNGDIKYEFVFEKDVWINNTVTTSGTISSPEYTNPIKITMMGKPFTIVGISATTIKMLSGTTGTAKKQGTTVTGVTSGDYTIYVTAGANNDWASFEIKDKSGNVVDTVSGISEGNSKDSSATSLTLKVTDVRVSGTDPATQIVETDVVVGPTGSVEHEYDSTADVDATGSANEAFPGATRWGIQYSQTGGAVQKIGSGSKIQVSYKPTEVQYLKAGEKVSLPNSFADLGFDGFNTNKFATITVKPYGATSAYFQGNASTMQGEMYGLELSSDTSGVIVSPANNFYTKAYVLFNATKGNTVQVAVGYPDTTGKILVNDTFATEAATTNVTYNTVEYGYAQFSNSGDGPARAVLFNYTFKINVGETDFYLNVRAGSGNATILSGNVTAGDNADDTVQMNFQNKTAATPSAAPQFRLGPTATSADETDVFISTESTALQQAGKKTQAELVDDSGILVLNPASNGASDYVKIKVPSKTLGAKVYFGKKGAAATTGTTTTSDKVVTVTTDVVKLDTEVSDADKTNNNLVLVGGPCVNTLVASLAKDGKFDYKCEGGAGTQPIWPGENFALVKVVQDAFKVGKVAVVVAGTRAQDTDLAALAIQSGKLAGNNATSVKLTGTDINSLVIV